MIRQASYGAGARIGWIEWLPFVLALAVFFALPEYVPFGARVLVYILFALSLDLILGYAGIVTLGHTAFFGLGAYVAGILGAKVGVTDPLLQLAAAGVERDRVDGGLRRNAIAHGSGRDVDRHEGAGGRHDGEGRPIRAERRAFGARSHVDPPERHALRGVEELDRRSGVADRERGPVVSDRDPLPLASGR